MLLHLNDSDLSMQININDDDYNWHTKNLAKIYKKYGDKYVVIRNKEVLAFFDTFDAGADYVDANNLAGKAIVIKQHIL